MVQRHCPRTGYFGREFDTHADKKTSNNKLLLVFYPNAGQSPKTDARGNTTFVAPKISSFAVASVGTTRP